MRRGTRGSGARLRFEQKDPGSGTTCTVDITSEPDFTAVAVRESAACLSFHGAGCNFEGRSKRAR